MNDPMGAKMTDELICSARGCTVDARYGIVWNNPKIHTPDRQKIWLACDSHESTLRDFLSKRGFYLHTSAVEDL